MELINILKQASTRMRSLFILAFISGLVIFSIESVFINTLNILFKKLGLFQVAPHSIPLIGDLSLNVLFGLVVLLIVTKQFVQVGKFYLNGIIRNEYELENRLVFLKNIQQKHFQGQKMMTIFSYHIEKASEILIFASLGLVNLAMVMGFSLYAAYLSPSNFLIIVLLGLFCLLPMIFLEKKTKETNKKIFNLKDLMNDYFGALFHSFIPAKLKNNNLFFMRASSTIHDYKKSRVEFDLLQGIKKSYPEIVGGVVIVFTLYSGQAQSSQAYLVPFIYCLLKIAQSVANVNYYLAMINLNSRGARKSRMKIQEMTNEKLYSSKDTQSASDFEFDSLAVNDLSLKYMLKKNMTFILRRGGSLLVKGPSGVGKTTLLKFLCEDCSEDKVKINGSTTLNSAFRSEAYFIDYDFKPFPCSLFENISLSEDYDETQINKVLKLAAFPKKQFDKIDPKEISRGEACKIAIARAFYLRPQIVIMDELLSALPDDDAHTVIENFKHEGITLICASHKEKIAHAFDQVLNL